MQGKTDLADLAAPLNPAGIPQPVLGSPAISAASWSPADSRASKAPLFEETWWIEAPSRQSTGSTVASDGDVKVPPAFAKDSPARPGPRRLGRLQERRGWKHFFWHVVPVPLALILGVVLGSLLTASVMFSLTPAQAAPAPPTAPYALAPPPAEVPLAYYMAPALNNSCLIQHIQVPKGPQTFDACGFVIRSTDEVWNSRGNVDAAIDKYFHEEYLNAGSWGRRTIGKRALRNAVLSEMRAFPDIRIHITDCVCHGNDIDGYKCAMPDILTGTNLGPSAYGPATGRYARWTGLVQSLVKKNVKTGQWQYFAEWGVHDEWALVQQLGLDFSRVPHPPANYEPLHDCTPLLHFGPQPQMDANDVAYQEAAARARRMRLAEGR